MCQLRYRSALLEVSSLPRILFGLLEPRKNTLGDAVSIVFEKIVDIWVMSSQRLILHSNFPVNTEAKGNRLQLFRIESLRVRLKVK